MNNLKQSEQTDIARGVAHMTLGARKAKGGATTLIQQAEDVAATLDDPTDKTVAYLAKVIQPNGHSLNSLANLGFSQEVLNAVHAVSRTPDESFVQGIIRARKSIIGKRVMLQYLKRELKEDVGERVLLKYAKAVVALVG